LLLILLHLFGRGSLDLNNYHYTPWFLFFFPVQTLFQHFVQLNEILLYLDQYFDFLEAVVLVKEILLLCLFDYLPYQLADSLINLMIVEACLGIDKKERITL